MRGKRKGFFLLALWALTAALFFTGCTAQAQPVQLPPAIENPETPPPAPVPEPAPEPEPESLPPPPIDPLTGLATDAKTALTIPVAIMINNYHQAFPQFGIAQAGILYECMTEGSITRIMAVFNNYAGIAQIGPVRSARDYFIDLAYNHEAYYIHYGGSPQAYAKVNKNKVPNLDGLSALDTVMFWRDKERLRKGSYMIEHSVFTSGEKIVQGLNYKKYATDAKGTIAPAFSFAEVEYTPEGGTPARKITIPYGSYTAPVYTYDAVRKVYLREQVKGAHIDGQTGEQLSFKNVLVLYVPQKRVAGDSAGRLDVTVSTSGAGLYITNGVAIPIRFEKKSMKEPVVYTTEGGEVLKVNPGKTFINCLDNQKKAVVEE